ncbi:DNA polymerase alpha subunit B [Zalerion maritima]|uniref:DNA polymerase alpha subunit B n=1 Tax=Zalerion maritima TaxID=339359 RepID=A0AAD5RTP6_9PEZI|nr:DNA polymerase alpha subunit B [Zalerion maritima]
MADDTVDELNERFGAGKQLDRDVILEVQSVMKIYGLSAQDAYFKWDSYCLKMESPEMKPSMTNIRLFKQDLQDALERSVRSHTSHIKTEKRQAATPRAGAMGGDVFGMLDGLVPKTPGGTKLNKSASSKKFQTPSAARVKQEPASSPIFKTPGKVEDQLRALGALPPSSFSDRPNPGEIMEVLNENMPAPEPPICPFNEPRIQLKPATEKKKLGYKNWAMKLSTVSEVLDDRIEDFKDWVQEYHRLEDTAFGNAAAQGTTEIVAVGRIASDSAEGKLNQASLVLETSRRQGGGLRVRLDMSKMKGFQFFPGQIVAAKGINGSGDGFTVSQLLDVPLLPSAASSRSAMEVVRQRLLGGPDAMDDDNPIPLNIIIASGPYTADDDLDFEPLHALCNVADAINADAMVLCGPFIDICHPLIASGDFDLPDDVDPDTATIETVFRHLISSTLNKVVSCNPSITIMLVPSVRDAIDKHVSWPQEEFPRKGLGLAKQVKVVGNPMTVLMNEIRLGVSSQDVLFELKTEELVTKPGDALARLSKHLIEQRHFFPLFPPADRNRLPKTGAGTPMGAMLDAGYLQLGEMVMAKPDVLVVPSDLPPFAKVVESVLVINPGHISKRRAANTYAKLTVQPPEPMTGDPNDIVGHEIFKRSRVEIRRI